MLLPGTAEAAAPSAAGAKALPALLLGPGTAASLPLLAA